MNSHQKKSTRKRNTRKKQTPNRYKALSVPIASNAYAPSSLINTLKYTDLFLLKTNVGQQYIFWRIRMGDVFDPDPLILSGSISGYNEITGIYRRFLVTQFTAHLEFVNNEAFPVIIAVAPSDIDLALVIVTPLASQNLAEYPAAKHLLLSEKGGMNKGKISYSVDLARFTGQAFAYRSSLAYAGLSASPSIQTFFNVSVTAANTLTSAGITQYATYTYRTVWSQRQTPQQ